MHFFNIHKNNEKWYYAQHCTPPGEFHKKFIRKFLKTEHFQLISFTMEDGDAVVDIIMKASNVIGLFFAFVFSVVTAIVLLRAPGMWPLFGIIGVFLCAVGSPEIL